MFEITLCIELKKETPCKGTEVYARGALHPSSGDEVKFAPTEAPGKS
jgi:hypothetical protein